MATQSSITKSVTYSPDGNATSGVILSESPSAGELWYIEEISAHSDGSGNDTGSASDVSLGRAVFPTGVSDSDVGNTSPGTLGSSKATSNTTVGDKLGTAGDGFRESIGTYVNEDQKIIVNETSDSSSSSSTLTIIIHIRRHL